MRTLVIGDIHGCMTALSTLVENVPIREDDLVITLGDYVDRGPDSQAVLDWLIDRHRTGKLVAIRGNHDEAMMDARWHEFAFHSWMSFGGFETLVSYGLEDEIAPLEEIPDDHWMFLDQTCVDYFELNDFICVHGNLDRELPLNLQSTETMRWQKFRGEGLRHVSGKTILCGHTAQRSGEPLDCGHTICLDTWVYGEGWLTCFDIESRTYWQGNEAGAYRERVLLH